MQMPTAPGYGKSNIEQQRDEVGTKDIIKDHEIGMGTLTITANHE